MAATAIERHRRRATIPVAPSRGSAVATAVSNDAHNLPATPKSTALVPTAPARRPSTNSATMASGSPAPLGDESNFSTNFQLFQQQINDEQKARAQIRDKDHRKSRAGVGAQAAASARAPHQPVNVAPPSGRPGGSSKKNAAMKLENLPGSIAPVTSAQGELVFPMPGHGSLATTHIYEKACRQYSQRIVAFALEDAVRRIQKWFRSAIIVRRSLRQFSLGVRVQILIRRIARRWIATARRQIADRKRREEDQHSRQPQQTTSAKWIQRWWRATVARRRVRHLLSVSQAQATLVSHREQRHHAALLIQATWRMVVQRMRTRLARSSLKNFRVGRVIHHVRWYFFRKDRESVRNSVLQKEYHAACTILRNWRAFAAGRERRRDEFISKKFSRPFNKQLAPHL